MNADSHLKDQQSFWGSIFGLRFIKFGVVGSSGTLVNLTVLYVCQEVLLKGIEAEEIRLSLSLAAAIFLATVNNFLWNRWWTWRDRKGRTKSGFFAQFGRYIVACWLSIALQFILTKMGSQFLHYMVANIIAIGLAAIVTFLLNDVWTFGAKAQVTTGEGKSALERKLS